MGFVGETRRRFRIGLSWFWERGRLGALAAAF